MKKTSKIAHKFSEFLFPIKFYSNRWPCNLGSKPDFFHLNKFKLMKHAKRHEVPPLTVGELLHEEMGSFGWEHADTWKLKANTIAPLIVGGSKKHGGADLGPTRAKQSWSLLGVDGKGLAEFPPASGSGALPKLTIKMTALIQGFPKDWQFVGKKTPAYRQVGNAFPPPVAKAMGFSIKKALNKYEQESLTRRRVENQTA